MACDVSIKIQPFLILYFNQDSKRKYLKSPYFVLISPENWPPFNFILKDMYNISHIEKLLFRKTVHLKVS